MQSIIAGSASGSAHPFAAEVKVKLGSAEYAQMCMRTLLVDPVLEPTKVSLRFCVEDNIVVASLTAVDERRLRRTLSALMQNFSLISRTLDEFG